MQSERAISEAVSVILIIVMILILALVVAALLFGGVQLQQKSALVSSEIKNQSINGKNIITIFHRAGDEFSLNSSLPGPHQMSIYIDNRTSSTRASPVAGLNVIKPGTTLFVYYNLTKNVYLVTSDAGALSANEVNSVIECPLKVRLVDETAKLLISTYNWTPCSTPTTPVITSITPVTGPVGGGTTVTITGTGFTSPATVLFGEAPGTSVTVSSATRITVKSPAHALGVVDVRVITQGGMSPVVAADRFTYSPAITSLSPTSGPSAGGTSVTITGTGFTSGSTVTFGDIPATGVNVVSATRITALSPAYPLGGTIDVRVTSSGITSPVATADRFTYTGVVPTVTSISPVSGPVAGGTTVTITGTGFTSASTVSFGGTAGTTMTFINATRITIRSPAHAAGTVDVTVTTVGGTSTTPSAGRFSYFAIPVVSSLNPASGIAAGGTTVIITGSNLDGATAVKFGTTSGTIVSIDSDTQLTVRSPAHAAGAVYVTVTTPGGTSANSAQFTYIGVPTISSVSPTNGPSTGGTTVTITGTALSGATLVTFGGTPAIILTNTASSITVTAPARTSGLVNVIVTTPGGSATRTNAFTFSPTITSLSRTTGVHGTTYTGMYITGTYFVASPVPTVTFTSGGNTMSGTVTACTATRVTFTLAIPAAQPTGAYDVTVTNNDVGGGTATLTSAFTVT